MKYQKKKIFDSISDAKLQNKRDLLNDYKLLRYRLGDIPKMVDFLKYNSRDPIQFVEYSKSYIEFVNMAEDKFNINLNQKDLKLLQISKNINNGSSIFDVYLLKLLVEEKI